MEINGLKHKCLELGQGHLVQFWDQLNEDQRKNLESEISHIDLKVSNNNTDANFVSFLRLFI